MAATSSCVSSGEQNELVVRTGLELRLRRFDLENLRTNHIYVIGGTHTVRMNCFHFLCKKLNIPPNYYYSTEYINSNSTSNPEDWYSSTSKYTKITLLESIRGIPVGYRTKGTLICFGNLSYDDKQCLYHLFGGKHPYLKTYRMFVDVMEETQKNGDAIVLTAENIMWFPGSFVDVPSLVDLTKQAYEFNRRYSTCLKEQLVIVCDPNAKYFSDWVNMAEKLIKRLEKEKFYPCILIPGVGNTQQRLSYEYAGRKWNFDIHEEWNSSSVFYWLMEKRKEAGVTEKKVDDLQVKFQEEPDLKTQVATLTETIKTLTDVVSKLAAKL